MQYKPWKPNIYIIIRFLENLFKNNDPLIKTRLQQKVNLNYDIFIKYLNWLKEKELIKIQIFKNRHEYISLTIKGQEAYNKIISWIYEFLDIE